MAMIARVVAENAYLFFYTANIGEQNSYVKRVSTLEMMV
jgi:hypothetical protein